MSASLHRLSSCWACMKSSCTESPPGEHLDIDSRCCCCCCSCCMRRVFSALNVCSSWLILTDSLTSLPAVSSSPADPHTRKRKYNDIDKYFTSLLHGKIHAAFKHGARTWNCVAAFSSRAVKGQWSGQTFCWRVPSDVSHQRFISCISDLLRYATEVSTFNWDYMVSCCPPPSTPRYRSLSRRRLKEINQT